MTRRSTGSPDATPHLPPMRSVKIAPFPASMQNCTACGSQKQPITAPCTPRSTRRRRIAVLSAGAPPPALSATSANTIGPPAVRRGQRGVDRAVDRCRAARRCARAAPRSRARAARRAHRAFAASPSAITTILAPTSSTSPQGKPCPNETERMPSLPSSACMRATKDFIGSTGVRHMLTMRQS